MSKLHIAILCVALPALLSCSDNIFGSSSAGSCGEDIKCLRLEAENAFRTGNYKKAYDNYEKITTIDTTASVGYFGMAKAGLWQKGINPFDMFRFADINKLEDGKVPFRDDSIKVQNRYYQGMTLAYNALSELNRRDSLTALRELYEKKDRPADGGNDSLILEFEKLCDGSGHGPCYENLSDREFKPEAYYASLLISLIAKTMLGFFDSNSDNCITKSPKSGEAGLIAGVDYPRNDKEWEEWDCKKIRGKYDYDSPVALNPDGTIDYEQTLKYLDDGLEDFYGEQLNDSLPPPPEIEDINKKIDDFNGNLDEVMSILGGGNGNWQDEISKYNDYASFYKVGTRLDEDGDGCIDEELLNKMDNDGDGIKGEDARLASLDPSNRSLWGKIGMNHVMMFNEEPNDERNLPMFLPEDAEKYICNEPVPGCPNKRTRLSPDSTGNITVIGFTQIEGYWTTDSLDLKLEVAQDTQCGNLKYGLEKRKNLVGGCWLFYSEEQFRRIWLNRHANNCCVANPNCAAEKN